MALRFTVIRVLGPMQGGRFQAPKSSNPVGTRGISGKNLYVPDPKKPKPFPYVTRNYNIFWQAVDKTTLRLDENSKLITVEGAHAIGKSQFAKDLAEELGMVYVEYPRMDDILINPYGFDYRKIGHMLPERLRPYDEKDFSRNPLGPVPGCTDRMIVQLFNLKFYNHIFAIRHILNTGQGVVMEGSPFSDYAHVEAAYNQGWIDIETKKAYKLALSRTLHHLLRPNLILYLDAPVDVVQKNIAARGNEWDKNSPVWTNKNYLNDIYNEMKRNYLKKMQRYCRVLVYDWSEPGDAEVVVEDIENLNMDDIDYYDDQQSDWRFHNEQGAAVVRYQYTNYEQLYRKMQCFNGMSEHITDADHIWISTEEVIAFEEVMRWIESSRYHYGFNKKLGDKNFWWKYSNYHNAHFHDLFYFNRTEHPRKPPMFEKDIDGFDYEDVLAIQKAGGPTLRHNRAVLGY